MAMLVTLPPLSSFDGDVHFLAQLFYFGTMTAFGVFVTTKVSDR